MRGIFDNLDLTSVINRGLDVVGSAVAKAPSMYVAPTDPRYVGQYQQPTQIIYPQSTTVATAGMPKATSMGGLNVSTNTLIIGAVVLLAFMLGKR